MNRDTILDGPPVPILMKSQLLSHEVIHSVIHLLYLSQDQELSDG